MKAVDTFELFGTKANVVQRLRQGLPPAFASLSISMVEALSDKMIVRVRVVAFERRFQIDVAEVDPANMRSTTQQEAIDK